MNQNKLYLSPFVYWGQTNHNISLRIDLKNVKNPLIDLKETELNFTATGIGAKGLNDYSFIIQFYATVNPNESFYKINDRHIEFVVKKRDNTLWPRLLQSPSRPQWIKVDFDKIHNEEEDSDTGFDPDIDQLIPNEHQNSFRNFGKKDFGRRRKSSKKAEDLKKTYLFLYNMFQFVGFVLVFIIFVVRFIKEGSKSMENAYSEVGTIMKFLHFMQLLEIIHPILGYTSGSVFIPIIQLSGRCFMIFLMIGYEPRMQENISVFYLFMAYTLIELIRYPYYMFHIFNVNIYFLTWMRYTAWIILYPFGFLAEASIIFQNIVYFDESNKFSISLPNMLNISFHLPTIMRLYLLIGFFPALYLMMSHMYRQRNKVLTSPTKKTV